MGENELRHYGIKGMKWGVRRYQNADGSLTPAGKKRYSRDILDNNAKKKENRMIIESPDPNRWVREDLERTKKVIDSGSNMLSQFQKVEQDISMRKPMDLSNMTDKQLRDEINRKLLEQQYTKLFSEVSPDNISKGRKYLQTFLDAGGKVLGAASSVAALAVAIQQLKKG